MSEKPSKETTILCIDDDRDILNLLKSILTGAGHTVITAAGAQEGLLKAREDKPDLILLDVTMPGMDGYEVCRKIKDDDATKDIPVIFITAKNEDADEARGLKMGAVDYIRKPFYQPIVKSRVRTQLDLKLKTDMLERLAAIDGLTNIYNRRKFDEILDLEWKRAARGRLPLALIMADVDHFKGFNDHYGHAAGDDCLRRVARGLNELLQRPADFLARYGGEEFAVMLPETGDHGVLHVAGNLVTGVANLNIPYPDSPLAGHVTISLGATTAIPGQNCQTPLQLIEAADSMLYAAKQGGRNRFCARDLSQAENR